MQGKNFDGLRWYRLMQELVQWSGEDAHRLDVEHPCEGSDRLTIPESLPTQSKVITFYLPKEVKPRKTSRSDVGSWALRWQFDWEEFIVVVRHTSAAQATTPEKIMAGSGE